MMTIIGSFKKILMIGMFLCLMGSGTLYAMPENTYAITCNKNGGDVQGTASIDNNKYRYGDQATVQGAQDLAKPGHKFTGWKAVHEEPATVSGKVSPLVYDDLGYGAEFFKHYQIIVELRDFNDLDTVFAQTIATYNNEGNIGLFTFKNIPEGDYVLLIFRYGYVTRAIAIYISGGTDQVLKSATGEGVFELVPGATRTSAIVEVDDIAWVLEGLNEKYDGTEYFARRDFNGDGKIDDIDWQLVIDHLNYSAFDYPGVLEAEKLESIAAPNHLILTESKIQPVIESVNEEILDEDDVFYVPHNIKLVAQWEPLSYTVTFDTYVGSKISPVTVIYNSNITKPENPEKTGYQFNGWYRSDNGLPTGTLTPWDFNIDTVTEDITLFARWNKINDNAEDTLTPKPNPDDGKGNIINSVDLPGDTMKTIPHEDIVVPSEDAENSEDIQSAQTEITEETAEMDEAAIPSGIGEFAENIPKVFFIK